ncbi:M16 family metallopeptidase [Vibrio parahaemolyticus]|uniref:M16 family metallopeptidase n=1 Tax=Vibrio parahaemolyticus TaxID=670 RepID=UPI00111D11EF|nr:insulinase family protein [Vibrio parahaemolyticus]MCX4132998.1 insulinase family protein [Vibrio parahaemolyticus]MCZ6382831.1 insulinase family protein [Vibrio parahaemolyticus]MDF4863350.1 insulinase family protein [Vibrio parahaemolyticus]MRD97923.1 insulinase family protein [Vibrio parahaemolyticus]TNZ04463.1 peptidase M16 [Vibrio parahaemolyticus]
MRSILLVPALLLSGCALTQQSTPIQPDANWHVNQLSNGMKYHIYPTQDQEVSVRLVMHIGSFQEEANQKGYAHFVEHMAFNGSTHFTGNDVVKLFEQSGGSFGADINAFTTYQQTSYKLDLANNEKLEDALTWMRDIGDGLEFAPAQVEKEKGVVLGEWRRANPDDKSFSMHAYEASIEGTLYAEHDPIGTRDAIENATSNGLKNFYEKWYQPQYAELIVTGNVDAKSLANIIKNKFSNWESTSDIAIEKRRDIRLNTQDEILPSNSMESPSLHLVIERGDLRRETVEQQHAEWRDEVAIQLIQQRLISLLNDAAEPYQYVYAQPYYSNYQRLMSAGISFSPDRREQMHQIFISALTSLRDYGVTQAELESITSNWYGELANLDSDWSKRKPNSYAEARIFQLEQDSVSQSKESYAQSLAAFLDKTTLESVNAQLKELLSNQPSFVIGMGKSETQAQFADVFTALNSAYLQAGEKPSDMNAKAEGFLQPAEEGSIVSMRQAPGGFQVYTLSNGVDVWFQKDAKAGGRAYIYFISQGGKAALDKSLYPAYELAAMTAVRSGLGEFSGSELDAYLRTNNIAFGPILEPTVHGVQVTTQKNRLVEALNGLYNLSTEIKVDERQLAAVKQEFKQERSAFLESPMGTLIQVANTSAYTPDSRHRLLSSDGADTVTPEQILAVHDQLFKTDHGYKMVIVADVEPEQITPLLRKYVASIKMKPGKAVDYRVSFNDELPARSVVTDGHEPSSFYLLRFTNTDKYNRTAKDTVIEDILERISAARVLETFREESSLDYSPSIYTMTQDGEPISDWLFESQVDPKDVGLMDKLLDKVFDDLAINITQKEVDTAAKQLAVAMQGLGDNPGSRAWVYSRYLAHDYGLDVVLDVEKAAKSVTLEEVKARAASAFGPNAKRSALILNPM